jgi:hypothetical protein
LVDKGLVSDQGLLPGRFFLERLYRHVRKKAADVCPIGSDLGSIIPPLARDGNNRKL